MRNLELKEFLKNFHEMNQIFDQSDNLISCDCYDISEFKKTTIKEKQDLFIIHRLEYFLNFSPHQWLKKFNYEALSHYSHYPTITTILPQDIEILGWCSTGPVLPHGEKVSL